MTSKRTQKLQIEISTCFSRLTTKGRKDGLEVNTPQAMMTEANQATFEAAASIIITLNSIPTRNKVPRSYFKDAAQTRSELTGLCSLLDRFGSALLSQMAQLNSDAIASIGGTDPLSELAKTVTVLCAHYEAILQKIPNPKDNNLKRAKRSGAPTNIRAKFIAQTIATYYKKITDKNPTISKNPYKDTNNLGGPYFYLIEEIFDLLKIEGNREYYARQAAKTLRSLTRQSDKTA